jgi:hypothetical protein
MKKKAIMWTASSCLMVFVILTSAVPIPVIALNDNIQNASAYSSLSADEKVAILQADLEVRFNGTAVEYFASTGSSGWNVQIDEVSSGPAEIMGHTVTVALWSAAGDQYPSGTIDPAIEPGDRVAVYGLYMDDDYVTLSESEGYYIKPVLKAGNVLFTTVSISNVSIGPGDTTTVPIMIYNVTNLSIAGVLLTYDPSVVQVTEMVEGDDFDLGQCMILLGAASGVLSNFLGLSGDITFANVTFKAVGNHSDTSPLNFSYANLTNTGLEEIPRIVENGTFSITSGNQPPTNPSLTPDKPEPQTAGTDITWTAYATDPDGDTLYYQFWIRGPSTENSWTVMQSWSTDNTWTWHTTSSDIGDTDIDVWIRDGHHEPPSSFDCEKVYYDYTIASGAVGAISVTSSPSGANIGLDGVPINALTPYTLTNVLAGTHILKLTLEGYQDWSTSVHVIAGTTSYVDATLTPMAVQPSTTPQPSTGKTHTGEDLSSIPVQSGMVSATEQKVEEIGGTPPGGVTGIQLWVLYNGAWTKDPAALYYGEWTYMLLYLDQGQEISTVETYPSGWVSTKDWEYLSSGYHYHQWIADAVGWHKIVADDDSATGQSNEISIYVWPV